MLESIGTGAHRPAAVLSLRAEHPGCRSLLTALRGTGGNGVRAAFRVGAETFARCKLWDELVEASHRDPGIDLVLAARKQPLTDLMGTGETRRHHAAQPV